MRQKCPRFYLASKDEPGYISHETRSKIQSRDADEGFGMSPSGMTINP